MKEFDYDLDYKNLTSQMQRLANFIVLEGEQGVLLVRPYTDDICAHWRFVDETAARKSSTKIYEMFCDLKPKGLHWYGHGERNSWRWVLQEHVGMLIIPVEGSIIKALVKSDPKTKIGEQIQKQRVLLFLRKCEIKLHTILNTKK